jgi:hypothetical protein
MRNKDVIGKRIVQVLQGRFWNSHLKRWDYEVSAVVLDDGSMIHLFAVETQECPAVTAIYGPKEGSR